MGKPSMFSSNYHREIRRRRIINTLLILLSLLVIGMIVFNKQTITYFNKFKASVNTPVKRNAKQIEGSKNNTGKNKQDSAKPKPAEQKPAEPAKNNGSFTFAFPDNTSVSIEYTQENDEKKFTGISQNNNGITYDIRDDGKAITFDYPKTSDIWIFNIDGSSKKLNPDFYKSTGGNGKIFKKSDILERYSNYMWAAKPKFLKDGRILYQSYVPWFRKTNNCILWAVSADGTSNRMILDTKQTDPVTYSGFTDGGKLIIEIKGTKYALDADSRRKVKID